MIRTTVSFTGFTVDNPLLAVKANQQNKPAFWPDHWYVIPEPKKGLEEVNIYAWFRNNCCHQWDMVMDGFGRRLFAFEDDGEAALFKLSF